MISIIVPVYNVEDYLSCCIDSILNQTYTDFELILVDDGSLDKCPMICDQYQKKDPRIKVIHKKNGGLSSARNAGLDIAKGEYVLFVDSDDFVDKNLCKKLIEGMENDVDIVMCKYLRVRNKDNIDMEKEPVSVADLSQSFLLTGREACEKLYGPEGVNYTVVWAKIYKTKFFENIRFPIGKVHEDEYVTYKLLYLAKKVLVLNEELYFYRINSNSIMGKGFSLRRYDAVPAYDERIKFFEERHEFELLKMTQKKKYSGSVVKTKI